MNIGAAKRLRSGLKQFFTFRQGRVAARRYAREQQRIRNNLEKQVEKRLTSAFNKRLRMITGSLRQGEDPSLTDVTEPLRDELEAVLSAHVRRVFTTIYEYNSDKYNKLATKQTDDVADFGFGFGTSVEFNILIEQYLRSRRSYITNMTQAQGRRIIERVLELREAGNNLNQIASSLNVEFGAVNKRRAALIARTETHSAAGAAHDAYHRQVSTSYGVQMKKQWVATGDARTRTNHAQMNGTVVEMDEDFLMPDGTRMKHVGDPAGGAANVINCRCVILYVDSDDQVDDPDLPSAIDDGPVPDGRREDIDLSDAVSSRNKISAAEYQQALKDNAGDLTYETIRRLPKPKTISAGSGVYYANEGRLVSTLETSGGSTLVHEFGHHVDAMLSQKMIDAGRVTRTLNTKYLSQYDKAFIDAFDQDRIENGLVRSVNAQRVARADRVKREKVLDEIMEDLTEIKRIESKVRKGTFFEKRVLKDESLGGLQDIVDAATKGYAYNSKGFYGHGLTYYRRKNRPEMYETFANCFQSYGTPAWPKVKKYFPRTAARFEEMLEEFIRTGDISFDDYDA